MLAKRKHETEGRPFAYNAFNVDVALVSIDHVLDDFRPESCAAGLSTHSVGTKKAIPNFGRHPTACVCDQNLQHVGVWMDLADNGDRSAGRNFRNGIVHQVVEG